MGISNATVVYVFFVVVSHLPSTVQYLRHGKNTCQGGFLRPVLDTELPWDAMGSSRVLPYNHLKQPPNSPWDVMGCQVATCFKGPGVSLGGSGVSITGVRILRALEKSRRNPTSPRD